ncbi:MAG: hypothetical protein IMY67_02780, partial [Bacteroidetes bacterium]|nr:hypothetical protein [Bacteroidota bacterium]
MARYIIIKDWVNKTGRTVKKGTPIDVTQEKFKELDKLGVIKDRQKKEKPIVLSNKI